MIELTGERLAGLGYRGLTKEQMNDLLHELYNAGEEIVGLKLAAEMSNEQLDAFEQFIAADDEAGALNWLERNFPHYRKLAEETFDELDEALRSAATATRPETRMLDGSPKNETSIDESDAEPD